MRVLSFEEFVKIYEKVEPKGVNWYILSYDLIKEEEREVNYRLGAKSDHYRGGILNALVQNGAILITSIVRTTICFASPIKIDDWQKYFEKDLSNYIYFHFAQVLDRTSIRISPEVNNDFTGKFDSDVVGIIKEYEDRLKTIIPIRAYYKQ